MKMESGKMTELRWKGPRKNRPMLPALMGVQDQEGKMPWTEAGGFGRIALCGKCTVEVSATVRACRMDHHRRGNLSDWGVCCCVKDGQVQWGSPHVAPRERLYSKLLREPRILLPELDKRIMNGFTQVVKYEPGLQFGSNVIKGVLGTDKNYGSLGQIQFNFILLEEIKSPDKEWWGKVEEEKTFPPGWISTLTVPPQLDPEDKEAWELV